MAFFEQRFKAALTALIGARGRTGLIIGFSGGADSTALLHLCLELRTDLKHHLVAAHLDHGLRGLEAARDREIAQESAQRLGLPFVWEKIDCRTEAQEKKLSLEEAARQSRYDFLERVRREYGAHWIAVGHNANDNAELVLMNLLRGAGPEGLSGIPPCRGAIIRPLLTFWREEIEAWLKNRGLSWVEDSSNQDQHYFRNRVRHRLLPDLRREFNPAVDQALTRTAALLRDEEAIWAKLVTQARSQADWQHQENGISLDLASLGRLNIALARRLIRAGVLEITGTTRRLTMTHVEAVFGLLSGPGGQRIHLPSGLVARVEGRRLVLGPPPPVPLVAFERQIFVPGTSVIPELGIILEAVILKWSTGQIPIRDDPQTVVMDLDRLVPPLTVRTVQPGDRFQPLGLTGTKKLSDFFIDAKVPFWKRSRVPLLTDQRGLVWVGGYRLDHRVRITPETRTAVKLSIRKNAVRAR